MTDRRGDTEAFLASIAREFGEFSEERAGEVIAPHAEDSRSRRLVAHRAFEEGRLLGRWDGCRHVFPAFQFDQRIGPLPVIADLITVGRPLDWTHRDLVLWLCSPTGYLGGARPVDLLRSRPEEVLAAFEAAATVEW